MIALLLSALSWGDVPPGDAFEGVGAPPLSDPPASQAIIDERTDNLAGILRCPVCQGLSVADSREGASLAMRERIREMIAAGYTDDQVIDYFIDRYGEGIVLLPGDRHRLVWLGPIVMFVLGSGMVLYRVRQRQSDAAAPAPPRTEPVASAEDDPYRARIRAELGED